MKLVIVESPAKAKTIQKYLGSGYDVVASMGHVYDLPKSKLGVDVDNDFKPQYVPIKGKEELIESLEKKAKKADEVILATDPDREGEAISWHLAHLLGLPTDAKNRVTFNEITKSGIQKGISEPRTIDQHLVDAQQARRVLDRLVGYKISPFLWRKVRTGLSAGRVQSVAVRLIVDREQEIQAFKPQEYWSIDAKLSAKGSRKIFPAKLHGRDGKKLTIKNEEQAQAILAAVKDAPFSVAKVKKSVRKRSPAPPFTTSTLQQEASRRLGFQARRTMKAAQELYEGVEIAGQGAIGLITYMRTDSLRISDDAWREANACITARFGEGYLPPARREYKSRRGAQDAHEAIRPSTPGLHPDEVKGSLTGDQYKLYKLIWERFIASQMADAKIETVSADIDAAGYTFRASGFTVLFDGFTALYEEAKDDKDEDGGALPPLQQGDPLKVKEITPAQHFTQPPPRYTEATLIKALEENGIGRPSTYAPTITTILSRNYVEREGKALKPTALGEVTTTLMKDLFKDIVDVDFTANMENELDEVESGKMDWEDTIADFYGGFKKSLEEAESKMDGTRVKIPDEATDEVCELCGKPMVIKLGRYGKFLACSGYPECKNTRRIVKETGGKCPVCGKRMLLKKSKRGRVYYGCEDNPKCPFMTWDEPMSETCPKCGRTLFKKRGRAGRIYCAGEGCGYERSLHE